MRIALNAHLLSGSAGFRSAGIHRYIDQLLVHLPAAVPEGWRLTALVGAQANPVVPGVEMRRASWNTESALRRIAWEQALQPWALRGFDGYHALAYAGPLIGAPATVVTVHDLSFVHAPERVPLMRRVYLRWLTGITCRRARVVIGVSRATAEDVRDTFGIPESRIVVAPNGVDLARFRPLPPSEVEAFRAAKGLPSRFWLFIGTLEPRKNLLTLLEAYATLSSAERLPLVLAGGKGWDYEPIFDAVERLKLNDAVSFPGYLPQDDLPLWYNSAEAFVYPSVFEGFGMPVLEAMACGVPVAVSNASALPEVAERSGLCIPPTDGAAWANALRRIGQDDDWRRGASEAGLNEAHRFTWTETARQTAAAYIRAFNV
ncbi:MAG: glycosyltransferase family 1 protein [Anaerolineae bacterium]